MRFCMSMIMDDTKMIRKTVTVDVELTAYEVALAFSYMSVKKQAEFFNSLADITSNWLTPLPFQLEAIIDSGSLTRSGKEIMRQIGEYGSEGD